DAGSTIDRIGQGRRGWNDRSLADPSHAQRMSRVGNLHDRGLDQWQVEGGRHPVIEQSGVTQYALVIVKVFFVEAPADSLRGAALHLPFNVARVDRLADVLCDGAPQDLNLAGIRIDFDIDQGSREGGADAARVDARPSAGRSASARELGRQ